MTAETIKHMKLTDRWQIDRDPEGKGLAEHWEMHIPATALPTVVPSIIQETLPEYHGIAYYWCRFTPCLTPAETDRILLTFGGVDYKATVWLNGTLLGSEEGGETPFSFDVTHVLKNGEENLLAVRVVNPCEREIDGLNLVNVPNRNKTIRKSAGSCLNSGGIWYGVELTCVPAVYQTEEPLLEGNIRTGSLTANLHLRNTLGETDAVLALTVYGKTASQNRIVSAQQTLRLSEGDTTAAVTVTVPDVVLWDIDNPFLYRAEITVTTEAGVHTVSLSYGFKEFCVKDGFFYLNGRKIFVKSAHSGNAFPIGQNYPVVPSQVRQDMVMAKTYGFNMVRSIAGIFRPEQLDVCDEIGLLVYEECMASWMLGAGEWMLPDPTNYEHDPEAMIERFFHSTEGMIRRDRNHACLAMWGLLNEMNPGAALDAAMRFLPTLRRADPTHLVLFNSGRFDLDDTGASRTGEPPIACGSNPYSDTWDAKMGTDGQPEPTAFVRGDYHPYPQFPMQDSFVQMLRTAGDVPGALPVFISESGIGPLFNVIEEYRSFQQYGYRLDLEDSVWLGEQSAALIRDWHAMGLEKVYPTPEMMLKESQRYSAADRTLLFNAIRANPRHNGYSLTGLLDHGMCGEGLWSLWRRHKPEVYDAVCDGWASLRFCLFVKNHVFSGETFTVEAVLANENVLSPGTYTADFAVMGECGTVHSFAVDFTIADDAFAVPVMKREITLDVPTGKYSLTAWLRDGGAPYGNRLDFYVRNRADQPTLQGNVYTLGIEEKTSAFLRERGASLYSWDGKTDDGLLLVGAGVTEDQIRAAVEAAEAGMTVLFLRMDAFTSGEQTALLGIPGLQIIRFHEWLYHKECIAANRTVFHGLPLGIVDSIRYGQTFPRTSFGADALPQDILCPGFYTGFHAVGGAYLSVHNMAGYTAGQGKLYLNCFALEENLGAEPAADLILAGLVQYLLTL
ncbi:MAG: hypothetical protein IKV57_10730 [Clostridia bacterium]|nr:hypothetical protein [Clostridia bacterium]